MATSISSWIKVAQGFRLVAQAASKIAIEEGGNVASAASRHGIDLAKNARVVAGMNTQQNGNVMGASHQQRQEKQQQQQQQPNPTYNTAVGNSVLTNQPGGNLKDEGRGSFPLMDNDNDKNDDSTFSNQAAIIEDENKIHHHQPLHIDGALNDSAEGQFDGSYKDDGGDTLKQQQQKQQQQQQQQQQLEKEQQRHQFDNNHQLKEGKAVPSTRIGRAMGFASLGVGLAAGTALELASRVVSRVSNTDNTKSNSAESGSSIITNDANSDRLARTLCRMRGAALKLGQMLSIQDETLLPPALSKALEQVRQGADAMPLYQLQGKMKDELGSDWREKFVYFDEVPFAAASIGQVHRAAIRVGNDEEGGEKDIVVKCQYPGVADSIDSDLNNLSMIVKMTGMVPPGLFIDEVIRVGRNELIVECNYLLEANNQKRFRMLVENDGDLSRAKFKVPDVIDELCTAHVLTTEYCPGGTIDKVAFLDQEERNRIGRNILRLTMKELFVWRFMQTDPNWGNFLYDVGTGTTYLIDFGSAREYSKSFVDGYLRIVWASANQDTETLMAQSRLMGFLTGEENDIMLNAHKMSGFTVGEPFATEEKYNFGQSGITGRISEHGSHFLRHRLTAPPEEVYTLHRKLAGAYNLCIRLGANIKCRDLLEEIVENYEFEDGQKHPLR